MVKRATYLFLIFVLLFSIASCASGPNLVGKWYDKNGRCLDIRSDGSYKLDHDYGLGHWKVLEDGTVEMTDYYGEIFTAKITETKVGRLFDWKRNGQFYFEKYPSDEELSNARKEEKEAGQEGDSIQTFASVKEIKPYLEEINKSIISLINENGNKETIRSKSKNDNVTLQATFYVLKEEYRDDPESLNSNFLRRRYFGDNLLYVKVYLNWEVVVIKDIGKKADGKLTWKNALVNDGIDRGMTLSNDNGYFNFSCYDSYEIELPTANIRLT